MREEMNALRGRIADTKQMMRGYRDRGQVGTRGR
jgi:hypothetical protein